MLKLKVLFSLFSKRQSAVLLGLLSMVVVVIAACTQPSMNVSGASGVPKEFRIGFQKVPNAELLTKRLGLVEDQFPDVSIQWRAFDSGRDVNFAILDGNIDVGLVGSVPVSTGIAQGLPYQVYYIHNIIGDNEALAVTSASDVEDIADLTGKSIGVPFGSTTHFSLLSALEQAGVSASDVKILDMQPREILAAWQRGDIDGGFVWQPTLSRLLAADGETVITARQLAEKGIITADLGVVRQEFAETYPNFLSSYVALLDKATAFYRENPTEAAAAMAREINLSPEESLRVMNEIVWLSTEEQTSAAYLGTPEAPGELSQVLKDAAEFMVAQDAIPSAPGIEIYQQAIFNIPVAADLVTVNRESVD